MGKTMYIPATAIESGMLFVSNHDMNHTSDTNVVGEIDTHLDVMVRLHRLPNITTPKHIRSCGDIIKSVAPQSWPKQDIKFRFIIAT